MTLHGRKPFRNVVFIKENTGQRGGRYWCLTLDCGHNAFRPIPTPNPAFLVPPVVRMGKKRVRGPTLSAPHRVKCLFCPDDAPSSA